MKIEVTEEHIRLGQRNHPCRCPVALAASETFGRQAYVNFNEMFIPDMDDLAFRLSDRIQRFIDDFDHECHVDPFSFEALTLPSGFVYK